MIFEIQLLFMLYLLDGLCILIMAGWIYWLAGTYGQNAVHERIVALLHES